MASPSGSLRITRDDLIKAIGAVDDVTIASIIATGATVDKLAKALAWMANDEPMMNAGRPAGDGALVDILAGLERARTAATTPPARRSGKQLLSP